MNIDEFIGKYRNHPILFVGTGMSLRYLDKSYTWDGLLKKISYDLKGNDEFYYDIKAASETDGEFKYEKIASTLESTFNLEVASNRAGPLGFVNDIFYRNMQNNISISRMKIYIASLLSSVTIKAGYAEELGAFKRASKNIGSIITTNYDNFLEDFFDFSPLIGNDILLSNPYGSVYKIHGCVKHPTKIIISEADYSSFFGRYELIRAQLLSLFIHNPIIFIGYSVSDENIKALLKTIFTYVKPNSDYAKKIRENFLLVEYEENSNSTEITEHDIDLEGFSTIRINKIKTDNFGAIYEAISRLNLPITAMDVRRVQNIVKEIYAGGEIKVTITEDLDSLRNSDKILAIGSSKTIQYQYFTVSEMITNYFKIMEESNYQILELINKQKIQASQFFPIHGFAKVCTTLKDEEKLKEQQKTKINGIIESIKDRIKTNHNSVQKILDDENIANSNKFNSIIWSAYNKKLPIEELESFIKTYEDRTTTEYKRLLCVYDLLKHG
ncbi:SIR2 family protein [Pseudomonas sp. Q11]|uniref:SIR2 family protein n=1 Tax=Pseudomonas sp. Q11 TaxID=2968470 RepID=UPI002108846E|nr:SIR2 family protein [Pseudomonas sp. Q11]MCQ6257369.1 SIR2 family protein [Pseudomonas sp. Q11]